MANLKIDLTGVDTIETVEAGKYVAKVVDVEETESKQGNPMLAWSWEIQDKEYEGVILKSFTSLMPNALFGLKGHLVALGMNATGKLSFDTKKLHGKKAILTVSKNDEDRNRVEAVKKYVASAAKAQSKTDTKAAAKNNKKDDDDDEYESPFIGGDDDEDGDDE